MRSMCAIYYLVLYTVPIVQHMDRVGSLYPSNDSYRLNQIREFVRPHIPMDKGNRTVLIYGIHVGSTMCSVWPTLQNYRQRIKLMQCFVEGRMRAYHAPWKLDIFELCPTTWKSFIIIQVWWHIIHIYLPKWWSKYFLITFQTNPDGALMYKIVIQNLCSKSMCCSNFQSNLRLYPQFNGCVDIWDMGTPT